uniref:ZP domain-containing protein n=1 Tax=Parastrongyloides trichosuri TaxID=131310 RepID=A0A0N4Z8D9_PARTI
MTINIFYFVLLILSLVWQSNIEARKKWDVLVPTEFYGTTQCNHKNLEGVDIRVYHGAVLMFKPSLCRTWSSKNGSFHMKADIPGSKLNKNLKVYFYSYCGSRRKFFRFEKRTYSTTLDNKCQLSNYILKCDFGTIELSDKYNENRHAKRYRFWRRKKSNVEVPTLINGTILCENKTMSGVQIIIYYGKRYIFKPAVYKTASSSNGSFYIFIDTPGSKQNGNLRVFSFSKCGERRSEYIFEKRAYSTTIEYKYKILITTLVWSLEDVELSGKKGENRNARNVNWIN